MKIKVLDQNITILSRIFELEELILLATPSDSWAIGEKSLIPSPFALPIMGTPVIN